MTNLWYNCHQRLPYIHSFISNSTGTLYSKSKQFIVALLPKILATFTASMNCPQSLLSIPQPEQTFLKDQCHHVTTLVKRLQWLCTDYGMKFKLLIVTFWLLRMSILPLTLTNQFPSLSPKHSMPILISIVLLLIPYSPSLPGKQTQPPTHIFPYIIYAFDLSCVSNNQNLS